MNARVLKPISVAIAAVGVIFGTGAAVAGAARPYEVQRWHEDTDVIAERCGAVVKIQASESGAFVGRAPGRDGIPRYTATWRGDATWTRMSTGKAFTFRWTVPQQEVQSVDNGDGTTTLLFQQGGQEQIFGPDGKRLFHLPGMRRDRVLIDNGDTPTNPFDDAFIGAEVLSFHGAPAPTADFCQTFVTLTG